MSVKITFGGYMISKKYLAIILVGLAALPVLDARRKKSKVTLEECGNNRQRCQDPHNACQCYCAFKPGPRDKKADDTLIFVENDPEGHYCYCKQRDIDKIAEDKKTAMKQQ